MPRDTVVVLRQLAYFSRRMFSQVILYLFLAVDVVVYIIDDYCGMTLPGWVFWILPVFAVYLAAFRVFRTGTANIEVKILEMEDVQFQLLVGQHGGAPVYGCVVSGYICNFGSETGAIQSMEFDVGLNGIFDEFVLGRAGLGIELSAPVEGHNALPWMGSSPSEEITLPLPMHAGSILPFSASLNLSIGPYFGPCSDYELEGVLAWLKSIDIVGSCRALQPDSIRTQEVRVKIDISDFESRRLRWP